MTSIYTKAADNGSSPLARGTQLIPGQDEPSRRIIPARAGNTVAGVTAAIILADHPRSRGEH